MNWQAQNMVISSNKWTVHECRVIGKLAGAVGVCVGGRALLFAHFPALVWRHREPTLELAQSASSVRTPFQHTHTQAGHRGGLQHCFMNTETEWLASGLLPSPGAWQAAPTTPPENTTAAWRLLCGPLFKVDRQAKVDQLHLVMLGAAMGWAGCMKEWRILRRQQCTR